MPPFLPVILAGVALYGAYRWASRQLAEQASDASKSEEPESRPGLRDLGTLELDAKDNVYRPKT